MAENDKNKLLTYPILAEDVAKLFERTDDEKTIPFPTNYVIKDGNQNIGKIHPEDSKIADKDKHEEIKDLLSALQQINVDKTAESQHSHSDNITNEDSDSLKTSSDENTMICINLLNEKGYIVNNEAKCALEGLFAIAKSKGALNTNNSKKYINKLINDIEFQVLINGVDDNSTIKKSDIDEIKNEYFGNNPVEDKNENTPGKVVASVDEMQSKIGSLSGVTHKESIENNTDYSFEDEKRNQIEAIRNVFKQLETLVLDSKSYPNPYISVLDRLIVNQYTIYVQSLLDNSNELNKEDFFMLQVFINEISIRINDILQHSIVPTFDIDEMIDGLDEDDKIAFSSARSNMHIEIMDFEKDAKKRCIEALKNS